MARCVTRAPHRSRGTRPSRAARARRTISSAPADGPPIRRQASHFATSRPEMGWKISLKIAIADAGRSRVLDQRQREPFAHHGQVAAAEELQRRLRHRVDVALDQDGVVVGAGAIGSGDEDHEWSHAAYDSRRPRSPIRAQGPGSGASAGFPDTRAMSDTIPFRIVPIDATLADARAGRASIAAVRTPGHRRSGEGLRPVSPVPAHVPRRRGGAPALHLRPGAEGQRPAAAGAGLHPSGGRARLRRARLPARSCAPCRSSSKASAAARGRCGASPSTASRSRRTSRRCCAIRRSSCCRSATRRPGASSPASSAPARRAHTRRGSIRSARGRAASDTRARRRRGPGGRTSAPGRRPRRDA